MKRIAMGQSINMVPVLCFSSPQTLTKVNKLTMYPDTFTNWKYIHLLSVLNHPIPVEHFVVKLWLSWNISPQSEGAGIMISNQAQGLLPVKLGQRMRYLRPLLDSDRKSNNVKTAFLFQRFWDLYLTSSTPERWYSDSFSYMKENIYIYLSNTEQRLKSRHESRNVRMVTKMEGRSGCKCLFYTNIRYRINFNQNKIMDLWLDTSKIFDIHRIFWIHGKNTKLSFLK